MKLKFIYTFFCLLALGFLFLSNSGGRAASQNWGNTGAPGDQETGAGTPWTCQTCHGGAIGVTMSVEILDNGTPVDEYVPGETYTARVTITHQTGTAPSAYGFQLVSLFDSDNSDVNAWSNPASNVQIATASNTGRSYAEHNGSSTSNEFEVDWTAPAEGSGNITFYAAGIGTNGNGMSSGDGGNNTSFTVEEGVVGVRDSYFLDANIEVYPNPATNFVNVAVESELVGEMTYEITDLQGRTIMTRTTALSGNGHLESFEVAHLTAGTYLIHLSQNNKALTTKFVKK